MVVLSKTLDWYLLQAIAENQRAKIVVSTRGQTPHFRALCGAIAVRTLKGCDFRTTEDLIRNYLPARFMCDLQNSPWTPDHNTIWEFETMLGEQGLQETNDCVLLAAAEYGFADPRGLCADTTAQEAFISHPTEVGHMNSFAKSLRSNLSTLISKSKGLGKKLVTKIKNVFSEIAKDVRSHRLFAKTKEVRIQITEELLRKSSDLHYHLGHLLVTRDKSLGSNWQSWQSWGINQIRGSYVAIYMHKNMMACDTDYGVKNLGIAPKGQADWEVGPRVKDRTIREC